MSELSKQGMDTAPIHLMCRLQWSRLRAWKKRSLRSELSVSGRIRPQGYSSSSSAFRGLLDEWKRSVDRPAILWIVTSYKLPGRSRSVPSLAAMLHVRNVYRGDDKNLRQAWKKYVWDWKSSKPLDRAGLCRIVEAEPGRSRFFPANDMGPCLSQLRYVRSDGMETDYSPRSVLRIRPGEVRILEDYARDIGAHTVFISYKHCDLTKAGSGRCPPWAVNTLAAGLINHGLGVWLDELCAPRGAQSSSDELDREEVRLLLAEGHTQSGVVIGLDTENFLEPGKDRQNWTLAEYGDAISRSTREQPLLRFVLHEGDETRLRPVPDDHTDWSNDLGNEVVPRIAALLN